MGFVIVALLILFSVCVSLLVSRLNRQYIELHELAKRHIRHRLQHHVAQTNADVFDACNTIQSEQEKAKRVMDVLGKVIGIRHWRPQASVPIGEFLRIDRAALESGQQSAGPTEVIDPFAYDLVESLLSITDKTLWTTRWQENSDLPKDEEALINFFMSMDICKLLGFVIPLMRDE